MKKSSLSEDTLLRMLVAMIAETIARLALLRTAGQYDQALEIIDHNLEELLGLSANLVRRLDDSKIVEMLTTNDILDVGGLYHVAEMFRQEAEIYQANNNPDQQTISQVRALNLFLEVGFFLENDFLDIDDRIDELFDSLGAKIPEDTLFKTFDYYEQVGAFDRAEISINRMLHVTNNNPDLLLEKKSFYLRLLDESDEELAAGGMVKTEIEQKLQEL
jgi:hypothetical protein